MEDAIENFRSVLECFRFWSGKESQNNELQVEARLLKALQARPYSIATPEGTDACRTLIPRNCPNAQKAVFRSYHLRNGHRGRSHTFSDISSKFYLEGGNRIGKAVTQNCLICAKKLAERKRVQALPAAVERRELNVPVFSRVAIDHLYLKPTCLSVMCIDTGMFALIPVGDITTDSAARALQRVSARYAVRFTKIHADGYSAFTSPKLIQQLNGYGHTITEVTITDKGASETNPVERLHKEAWSIVRCKQFDRLRGHIEEQDLEEIASIVSSRPLGLEDNGSIITPATLAFGPVQSDKPISTRLSGLCLDTKVAAEQNRFKMGRPIQH